MVSYKNGKIYKLINSVNDKIYIGSTCQSLGDRMRSHRSAAKNPLRNSPIYSAMKNIGTDHFKIELIESFSCKSKQELEIREFHIIRRLLRQGARLLNSSTEFRKNSQQHSMKTSIGNKGKRLGSANTAFKRGTVYRCDAEGKSGARWRFKWSENGKSRTKSFSILKFTENGARRMAEQLREEVHPEN